MSKAAPTPAILEHLLAQAHRAADHPDSVDEISLTSMISSIIHYRALDAFEVFLERVTPIFGLPLARAQLTYSEIDSPDRISAADRALMPCSSVCAVADFPEGLAALDRHGFSLDEKASMESSAHWGMARSALDISASMGRSDCLHFLLERARSSPDFHDQLWQATIYSLSRHQPACLEICLAFRDARHQTVEMALPVSGSHQNGEAFPPRAALTLAGVALICRAERCFDILDRHGFDFNAPLADPSSLRLPDLARAFPTSSSALFLSLAERQLLRQSSAPSALLSARPSSRI